MARLLGRHVRWKRRRAVFRVAAMTIISRQLSAQINDQDVHKASAAHSAIFFTRSHQTRTESTLLPRRIDRQQSQISTFTPRFDVAPPGDPVLTLTYQKGAGCK